jgi:hypothetical protein
MGRHRGQNLAAAPLRGFSQREDLGVPVREELVSQKLGKKKISEPTPKTSPPWGAGGQNPVVVLLSF